MIWDKIQHLPTSTAFVLRRIRCPLPPLLTLEGAEGSGRALTVDRGLELVLGWPLGFKVDAKEPGLNSWLFGFSCLFPPPM